MPKKHILSPKTHQSWFSLLMMLLLISWLGKIMDVTTLWILFWYLGVTWFKPCFIPYKNSLQKLLSFIGLMWQNAWVTHTTSFVIVRFFGNQYAQAFLQSSWLWMILCALHSKMSVLGCTTWLLVFNNCLAIIKSTAPNPQLFQLYYIPHNLSPTSV
jgi:hypothetical protein